MAFKILIRPGNHYVLFRRMESYRTMRFNYIPTELSCTVVRVKILTEKEIKNNKEGKKIYIERRISRKRHRSKEGV
jgi:hypothetical protein